MNSSIEIYSGSETDKFFEQEPVVTDWNEVYGPKWSGNAAGLLGLIKSYEPLYPGCTQEHEVWVLQQQFRLTLRRNAELPLTGHTCGKCGLHPVDPTLNVCLWCEELDRQLGYTGSRGSCSYLSPKYDHRSKTWGIVYYNRHNDNTFLLWVASGYENLKVARLALYPIALYDRWLERKYQGVGNLGCHLYDSLMDLGNLLKIRATLPFDPGQFHAYLRDAVRQHSSEDHDLLNYTIQRAIEDHQRKNNE